MKVTLGGDRLGSGNKNKIALRNYERSTHNLDAKFTSSMQCGVLYPFSVMPAMRGDSFTIDVDADARTVPTKGPLFGSFKMQIDYFQCPIRLYQAILHNNPLAIGLKMNQVKFPLIGLQDYSMGANRLYRLNETCLMKYLGVSGLGVCLTSSGKIVRRFNAIPVLAYYDIFKTYYSNKQEENAYVITAKENNVEVSLTNLYVNGNVLNEYDTDIELTPTREITISVTYNKKVKVEDILYKQEIVYEDNINDVNFRTTLGEMLDKAKKAGQSDHLKIINKNDYTINIITNSIGLIMIGRLIYNRVAANVIYLGNSNFNITQEERLKLEPFNLQNIDDMRLALLSKHTMGVHFTIEDIPNADWNTTSGTDQTGLPYSALIYVTETEKSMNDFPLNGLVVKTYQSDLFNNWIRTEWIDGENGIAAITAISTNGGSFTIDTLNLSEKLYNMLNRVAISDGSYEGWQDAVYTESPKRHIESPVYLGGSSNEIVFEEIVQTTPTGESPLGTLGGKGKLIKRKGGHIHVKIDEASFIIGIVSLTPRVNYTQGNEWYMTDLMSMDDLHKPALDGIGFQNLMTEQLAYWGTKFRADGVITERSIIGKVPAWINYMTRVDKGFGDFARTDGLGFMLLQRNYEYDSGTAIKDATTYIDPEKYNYAFAYRGIDAQNFWVQIYEHVTARRLMSAKQIPNI